MTKALYAPWPSTARRTYGWAAILLAVAGYAVSSVVVIGGMAIYGVALAIGGAGAAEVEAALTGATLTVLLPLLLGQFVVWGALTIVWTKVFERRPLATIGFGRGAVPRYFLGLVLGVVLVCAIGAAAMLLGVGEALNEGAQEAITGSAPPIGAILVVLAGCSVFLIQGAAEEIVFRGWLMSTLTARWGAGLGVAASSLVFMLFHAHVFISGFAYGLAALLGLGLTGLAFALLCVLTRSVWEAVAAHGAFNAAAVGAPTLALLMEDPALSAEAAFAQVFARATGTAGADAVGAGAEILAQALAAGVICAVLAALIALRARKRA